MKKNIVLISVSLVFLTVILIVYSCKHEIIYPDNYGYPGTPYVTYTPPPPPPQGKKCNPDSVYFDNDILPILTSNCTMCHNASGGEENFNLTSYSAVMYSGIVRAGNVTGSKMVKVISATGGEDRMPPSPRSRLTQTQIDLIKKWIAQGAKYLKCDACDTTKFTFAASIFPIIQNNCLGCHSGSSPSGGVSLANYNDIMIQVNNGKLMCDIRQTTTNCTNMHPMPKGGAKLSECIITQIQKWIDDGAKNN